MDDRERGQVLMMLSIFKDVAAAAAAEVLGYRVHMVMKKGNVWWTGKVKEALEGNREDIRKCYIGMWLEKPERGGGNEYRSWRRLRKELVKGSKITVDEESSRKPGEKFSENKELFGKRLKGRGMC